MSDPIAQQILEAVATRLEAITTANGYNTNAGADVELGRMRYNGNELNSNPVLCVYDVEDSPIEGTEFTEETLMLNLSIAVDAFAKRASGDTIHETAHKITADVKKAVLQVDDKRLNGLSLGLYYQGRQIEYPEEGGNIIAIGFRFLVPYKEKYGDPTQ